MNLWQRVKKGLKYAALSYALAYGGTAFVAGVDYKVRHREALIEDPPPSAQDIRSFQLEDGRLLTVLGENHLYNESESERAPRIANHYSLIAHEGGGRTPLVLSLVSDFNIPIGFIYTRATGRGYHPTIHSSAPWRSVVHLEIEEDSYQNRMTNTQRAAIVALTIENLLIAPLIYFEAKNELEDERNGILDNEASWLERKAARLEERDETMARNLAALLEERHSRRVLLIVGRWHVDGVIRNLEKRMTLTPVENPDFE